MFFSPLSRCPISSSHSAELSHRAVYTLCAACVEGQHTDTHTQSFTAQSPLWHLVYRLVLALWLMLTARCSEGGGHINVKSQFTHDRHRSRWPSTVCLKSHWARCSHLTRVSRTGSSFSPCVNVQEAAICLMRAPVCSLMSLKKCSPSRVHVLPEDRLYSPAPDIYFLFSLQLCADNKRGNCARQPTNTEQRCVSETG